MAPRGGQLERRWDADADADVADVVDGVDGVVEADDDDQVVVRALLTQSKGDVAELWIQEVFKGDKTITSLIITSEGGKSLLQFFITISCLLSSQR